MVSARSPTSTWVAKEGKLYMHAPASGVTFDNSVTLSGSFNSVGQNVSAACKNITITPPETSHEKQDFMGRDGNTFQNALLDEKPVGMATITGTLILGEDETVEDIISGTFASAPTGYSRYKLGSDNTSDGTVAACVSLTTADFGNYAAFAFDNAKFTKLGDTRIGSPDAHWEQDFKIVCLPKDYYFEFQD